MIDREYTRRDANRPDPRVRPEVLLAGLDLGAFYAITTLALLLRFRGNVPLEHTLAYLYAWPLLLVCRSVLAYVFGLYDFKHKLTPADHGFARGRVGLATPARVSRPPTADRDG